jgi:hypothetical protein
MDTRGGARLAVMPQTPDEMLSAVSESLAGSYTPFVRNGWPPAAGTSAWQNGYACGGKASRNVRLILGLRNYPHHLMPFILILLCWF